MIRILVVDDQKTVRESLRSWLEPVSDFEVVGTASDGHSAIEQVEILKPDIVLVDMQMPALDGVETTSIICRKFIGVKVIILSMYDGEEYVTKSLQAGATGYLLKNTPRSELIEAIVFVNRGYSQFAPGLINKVADSIGSSQLLEVEESKVSAPGADDLNYVGLADVPGSNFGRQVDSSFKPKSKKYYFKIWLLGNSIIWLFSLSYILFKQPSYTSKWTIALPASNLSTRIDLPGVGQASSESESPYNSDFADPRENYKYLAGTEELLAEAAASLAMPLEEFGEPKVEIPSNTTLIEFEIDAQQPATAQKKAIAIQKSLRNSLQRLRQDESKDSSRDLESTLDSAAQKLRIARQKLSQFQLESGLSSSEQTTNLTYNIEQLRKQRAEIVAQEQKVSSSIQELQNSLNVSPATAAEAMALQSDPQFKEYNDGYSQVSRELTNLNAKFSADHPAVLEKQAEQEQIKADLYRRGEVLLSRPVTESDLKNVNSDGNSSLSQRANLFQQLVSLKSEQTGLERQANVLRQQIAKLETRMTDLSQASAKLQQLQQEVQLAQAVYSSTATRLDLTRSQTSASYPPVSLVAAPNLPRKVSSPKKGLVLFGSALSSLLLTSGLYSLWLKNKRDYYQAEEFPVLVSAEKASQNGKGKVPALLMEKIDSIYRDRS